MRPDDVTLFRALCAGLEIDASDVTYSARERLKKVLRELRALREVDAQALSEASISWRELGWTKPLSPEDLVTNWPQLAATFRRRTSATRHRAVQICPECEVGGGLHVEGCSRALPPNEIARAGPTVDAGGE